MRSTGQGGGGAYRGAGFSVIEKTGLSEGGVSECLRLRSTVAPPKRAAQRVKARVLGCDDPHRS